MYNYLLGEFLGLGKIVLDNWENALKYIFELSKKSDIFLVLDEFQYIAETSPEITSILQFLIDEYKEKSKLKLVLCGSSMSFMEGLLSYKNPLYGRADLKFKLQPINFENVEEFLPRYDYHQLLIAYSIVGGIPMYLNLWDDSKSIKDNIRYLFLEELSPLKEEPTFILMNELKQPRVFQSIIEAIVYGRHTPSEIASQIGISDSRHLQPYLKNLEDLGIIEREIPALIKNPRRTRKTRYIIKDNLFNFWYRFIFSNFDRLELSQTENILEDIYSNLNNYVSFEFEKQARKFLAKTLNVKNFGRFWVRDVEI